MIVCWKTQTDTWHAALHKKQVASAYCYSHIGGLTYWQLQFGISLVFRTEEFVERNKVAQRFLMSQHRVKTLLEDPHELSQMGVTRDIVTDRTMPMSANKNMLYGSFKASTFDVLSKIIFKGNVDFEIAVLDGFTSVNADKQIKTDGYTDADCIIAEFHRYGWSCKSYEVSELDYGAVAANDRLWRA